jgi:hypothetical protein
MVDAISGGPYRALAAHWPTICPISIVNPLVPGVTGAD